MKFKILNAKEDCVLLSKVVGNDIKYVVKDIEGDVIYICLNNKEEAEKKFKAYDINKVREEEKSLFLEWLSENAEA